MGHVVPPTARPTSGDSRFRGRLVANLHDQMPLRLSLYHDDQLAPAERADVEVHLRDCADCRQRLADYRRIGLALRAQPDRVPAPPAHELVRRARGGSVGAFPLAATALRLAAVLVLAFGLVAGYNAVAPILGRPTTAGP